MKAPHAWKRPACLIAGHKWYMDDLDGSWWCIRCGVDDAVTRLMGWGRP